MKTSIEKHTIKISVGIMIAVIISIISMSMTFASWKTQMEAEHTAFIHEHEICSSENAELRIDVKELQDRAEGRDIQLATINTKLANIEALLVEIKTDIKN